MNDSNNVIKVFFVNGKSGILIFDYFIQNFIVGSIYVNGRDFCPGNKNLSYYSVIKFKYILYQFVLGLLDGATFFTLRKDESQFFFSMNFVANSRLNTYEAKQQVRHVIQYPNKWCENDIENPKRQ